MATFEFAGLPRFMAQAKAAANLALAAQAAEAAKFVKGGMGRGPRGTSSAPGTPPNVQRNVLRGGVVWAMTGELQATVGVLASVKYARIHEKGGLVMARRSRFLTIPVGVEGKRHATKHPGGTRTATDLVFIRTRRGAILAKKIGGKNARIQTMYVLKRSISLPPRPYLRPGVYNNIEAIRRKGIVRFKHAMRGYVE